MSWDNDPTLLQNLISRLRSLHPTASLLTDLLTIHNDAYVVRASIHLGDQCLATGLSSARSVEQAEDQAQLRAMRSLGLQQPSAPISTAPGNVHGAPSHYPPSSPPDVTPPGLASANGGEPNGAPIASSPDWAQPDHPEAIDTSGDRASSPPTSDNSLPTVPSSRPIPKPKPAPTPSPNAAVEASLPLDNIDRSDDIAKIMVEMTRLGWTKTMGREHLRQTYGKETRQELSDEELLDFLSFLEAQPS